MGAPAFFSGLHMRTTVYIDGHNLYHGSVKGTAYKWLDLHKSCQNIVGRGYNVDCVKYFTSKVKNRPNNPGALQRQMAYINALKQTYPNSISVVYGYFKSNLARMRVATPPPNTIEVIKTEEKGTDVNISVHLLNDAWLNSFDCGVLVSNDADMAEAMKLVRAHHPQKQIGLINPYMNRATLPPLSRHAHFVRKVRNGNLVNSQLPNKIPGSNLHKPPSW